MIFEEKRYVMIKPIMKDEAFLAIKSAPATKMDTQVAQDLKDTLQAYSDRCVGMAANMIGVKKNIIIVNMGFIDVVMFNPVIVSKHDMYETEEGCLSLDGVRKTTRYQEIPYTTLFRSIGVSKNIIIFAIGPAQIVMYNPKITKKSRPYKVKEGCLSLDGERNTTRYENITVEYQDESFKKCKQSYSGFVAQIIQHEIDHCNGIII